MKKRTGPILTTGRYRTRKRLVEMVLYYRNKTDQSLTQIGRTTHVSQTTVINILKKYYKEKAMTEQLEGIPLSIVRAAKAIEAFKEHENGIFADAYKDDLRSLMTDLFTDLMHWADENGIDYRERLETAEGHHNAEVGEAKDGNQG